MFSSLKQNLKKLVLVCLVTLLTWTNLCILSPRPAYAIGFPQISIDEIHKLIPNKSVITDAKKFLNTSPDTVCRAYIDYSQGKDGAAWEAMSQGAEAAFAIADAVGAASAAGAGSLAGYAGMASVVSHLGLGSLMTAIAGGMGSNVAGAAATAVVTSAVGGPVVMGAILAGSVGATAFGTYKLGQLTLDKLGGWAESYCS